MLYDEEKDYVMRMIREVSRVLQKETHYFANKGPSSQGYCFSCGHVWT